MLLPTIAMSLEKLVNTHYIRNVFEIPAADRGFAYRGGFVECQAYKRNNGKFDRTEK